MKVLLTGGAGYIGSHMCRMLIDANHHVTVFDNLSRGHRDAADGAELVIGDIRSMDDLRSCFKSHEFDLVMHFAALAYVGESVLDPSSYYNNNVGGTLTLLGAMLDADVRRIVFSSSCSTYGEPEGRKLSEAHAQIPVNPYGRGKLMVERILRDYSFGHEFKSISLRYFNAAGCDAAGRLGERHEPETHLIPLVLREALRVLRGGDIRETTLKVFGVDLDTPDGTCVRDFIHVSDICSAHLLAAQRLLDSHSPQAEAFNLGTGEGCSVLQVIEACRRVTGIDIQFSPSSRRDGDPVWLVADARLAYQTLQWKPNFTNIDRIIETAWSWMKQNE